MTIFCASSHSSSTAKSLPTVIRYVARNSAPPLRSPPQSTNQPIANAVRQTVLTQVLFSSAALCYARPMSLFGNRQEANLKACEQMVESVLGERGIDPEHSRIESPAGPAWGLTQGSA